MLTNEINNHLPAPYAMPNYLNNRLRPGSAEAVKAHLESGVTTGSIGFRNRIRDAAILESERSQAENKGLSLLEPQEDTVETTAKRQRFPPENPPLNQAEESGDDSQGSVIVKPLDPFTFKVTPEKNGRLAENLCSTDSVRDRVPVPGELFDGSDASEAEQTSKTVSAHKAENNSVVPPKFE